MPVELVRDPAPPERSRAGPEAWRGGGGGGARARATQRLPLRHRGRSRVRRAARDRGVQRHRGGRRPGLARGAPPYGQGRAVYRPDLVHVRDQRPSRGRFHLYGRRGFLYHPRRAACGAAQGQRDPDQREHQDYPREHRRHHQGRAGHDRLGRGRGRVRARDRRPGCPRRRNRHLHGGARLMSDARLAAIARHCRVQIIRMLTHAGSGHPGGSLSVIDILTALYFGRLRYDAKRPDWPDRDRVVLSKGHTVPALYAVMARAGFFPESQLVTLRKLGSPLQGHPDRSALPGIEAATGSLGQGLSISLGLALGLKLGASRARVYCILGDGETQEGQVWEAAMAGPKLGQPDRPLDNLCVILDYNKIQLDNFVAKIMDLEPVVAKWQAFGWPVLEIDGHDTDQINKALDQAEATRGAPTFVVAHTVKGKGVSFMENDPEWHGKAPKPAEAIRAIREILGVGEAAWDDYLKTDPATRAIVDELAALEAKGWRPRPAAPPSAGAPRPWWRPPGGIAIGEDGYSQMGVEDIACIRALPNIPVIQPADELETKQAVAYAVEHAGPLYLRLTRQSLEPVCPTDYRFQLGRWLVLRPGHDVTLVGTGGPLFNCLGAAKLLEADGISAEVINAASIKPLDEELLLGSADKTGHVVTVEDHTIHGGLGGAVAEALSDVMPMPQRRLGVQGFGESGDPRSLYAKHGLHPAGIAASVPKFLGR